MVGKGVRTEKSLVVKGARSIWVASNRFKSGIIKVERTETKK